MGYLLSARSGLSTGIHADWRTPARFGVPLLSRAAQPAELLHSPSLPTVSARLHPTGTPLSERLPPSGMPP